MGRFGGAAAVLGTATLLGLFFADEGYYLSRANFGTSQVPKALWWNLTDWYAWAAFVPGIFWVCRTASTFRHRTAAVLLHLAAGACFAFAHGAVLTTAARIETGHAWFDLWLRFFVVDHTFNDVFTYFVIVCSWYTLTYYRKFRDRELIAARLESQLARAELQALKTQLNPHFLFNTLHSISSLGYDDPREASRMLAKLSDLLRTALADEPVRGTTLARELEFNRQYLDIEKMRLGDRLTFELDSPPESLEACVPSFILQPLVENAIRHGIAPFSRNGRVWVRSRLRDGMLDLEVGDSGPGGGAQGKRPEGHGIGLKNTRLRLEKLYGGRHTFEVIDRAPLGFLVRILIPFERVT